MQTASIVFQQVVVMFMLVALGYWLFRIGKITKEGSKTIGNILIYLVLPSVIINGFLVERTMEHVIQLLLSAVAAIVTLTISILVSRFLFKKNPIAHFASAFSNPGFFGIPLIVASLGSGAVFYVAAFIAAVNLGQWTYGVAVMTERPSKFNVKTLIKAPFAIAILIGLILFASGIEVPALMMKTLNFVTGINTPLAMMTIGVYLAQTDILKMFVNKSLYLVSLSRLAIIPLICLAVLSILPAEYHDMKLSVLLAIASPVGSNVAVYAQLHDRDYGYAVETVVISTLLSIISLPCIVMLAEMVW